MSDAAEFDFRHETAEVRIELKSARARNGILIFQYVRPRSFDVCVCLGWDGGQCRYWVFESEAVRPPFLSQQHRASDSFQLRIPRRPNAAVTQREVAPDRLRASVDIAARRSAKRRKVVRLDPALEAMEGWPAVAKSMTRQAIDCGFPHWVFVFRLLEKHRDPEEPDLLPYPSFSDAERRVEFRVRPEPVLGGQNIRATAESFFAFLLQYLDDEDVEDDDAEP